MKAMIIRNLAAVAMVATMVGSAGMASAADWRGDHRDHVVIRGHDDTLAIAVGVGLVVGAALLTERHPHYVAPCREVVVVDHRDWRRDRDYRRWR